MATYVRRRVFRNVAWEAEDDSKREARRDTLCEFDGLLAHLEEINLRGGKVPPFVLGKLREYGITCTPDTPLTDLIEAVFVVQERFMRQPIELPGRRTRRRKSRPTQEELNVYFQGRLSAKS